MLITNRLNSIINMVPPSNNVVDVGTDHGFVPFLLVKKGISDKAIATDISSKSLDKAKEIVTSEGLTDRIETRVGNGLSVITPGEVDTIIIAGMGGILITEILGQSIDVVKCAKTIILQPMVAQDVLRRWLVDNSFTIIDEDLVKEGHRFYEIIKAVHGLQKIQDDIYFDIGRLLVEKQHPLLEEYILHKIAIVKNVIEQIKNHKNEDGKTRYEELKAKLIKYKEIYRCYIKSKT